MRADGRNSRLAGTWRALTIVLAAIVLLPAATYVAMFFAQGWPPAHAFVRVGSEERNANVNVSRDGRYVRIDYGDDVYVVDTATPMIGRPSRNVRDRLFGWYRPKSGFFGVEVAADNAKSEHDPHLSVSPGRISFVDYEDRLVAIEF